VGQAVLDLWPDKVSRLHSAYNRLGSMVQMSDSEEPLVLAELGLFNFFEEQKKLGHFMEGKVSVESIYNSMQNLQDETFDSTL
jgi:hypothetical protein